MALRNFFLNKNEPIASSDGKVTDFWFRYFSQIQETTAGGEALSRVNDTNVTVTLSGTPNSALLQPVTMILGWNGNLSVARGGTGVGSFTNTNSVLCTGTTTTGNLQHVSGTGTAGQVLTSNGAGQLPSWKNVLQTQSNSTTAGAIVTSIIPRDGTTPQNTEGDQLLIKTFTPQSSSSTIRIEVFINLIDAGEANYVVLTLFNSNSSSAIAATAVYIPASGQFNQMHLEYEEPAVNTSARTYSVRGGISNAGTGYFGTTSISAYNKIIMLMTIFELSP